jgi:trigger factor
MQVTVESGEGLQRRMRVDLPAERVESEVDKRLRDLARTVRLPGFRPGKVPLKLLRQRFGAQVQSEVLGQLVESTFPEALGQQQLRPAGKPRFEPDIDQSHYAYTATFEVLPKIDLAPLAGRSIQRPVAEVTEADLAAMIERLRRQRRTWTEVDRPAQEGDRVTVSFTAKVDGEDLPGGTVDNAEIELGSGRAIPGFESGLLGTRGGEDRHLDLRFPDDYQAEHLKGRPVAYDVRVSKVTEPVLPEVDAEFARDFGIADGDVERLYADVRQNMERELRQRTRARVKNQVMDLLLEANPIELPGVLVSDEIAVLKEQTRQNAGAGKLELPDHLFEASARRRVALGLIIAELVRANGIQVDPARVQSLVEEMASTYEEPQELIDFYYGNREHLAPVETLALEEQVVDWVLSQVAIVDESTSFEELTKAATAS